MPKPAALNLADKSIHFSPVLKELARIETREVFAHMKTAPAGLSESEAASRLAQAGPNVVAVADIVAGSGGF